MIDRRRLLLSLAAMPVVARAQVCAARGRFEGRIVSEWLPDGRTMRLIEPFCYVDAFGKKWSVPARARVNGASIPGFLWNEIGPPFVGLYRDASVVHDWYCAVRTEPSLKVHQMFYEAMLVSGLSRIKALLMYAGVRLGGPSWDELTIANQRLARLAAMNDTRGYQSAPSRIDREGHAFAENERERAAYIERAARAMAARERASEASDQAAFDTGRYRAAFETMRQNEVAQAEYRRMAAAIDGGGLDFAEVQQLAGTGAVVVAAARDDAGMLAADMGTAAPAEADPARPSPQ